MNCAKHPDVTASAFCRTCGKALCSTCARDVRGVIYCEECLANRLGDTIPATPPPYATVPPTPVVVRQGGSPGLAALLSIIPGVGQMYNEQYAKGLIFVLIFAALIQIAGHVSGVIGGLGIPAFWIYQIFDAYKTAEARRFGQPLPDPFGLNDLLGGKNKGSAYSNTPAPTYVANPGDPNAAPVAVPIEVEEVPAKPGVPVGAIVLIGLGILFLLDSFDLFRFDWFSRTWPVILIVIGVWIFIRRREAAAK